MSKEYSVCGPAASDSDTSQYRSNGSKSHMQNGKTLVPTYEPKCAHVPRAHAIPATKPWPKLCKEFTQDTTLHGIRFIAADSIFVIRKVLWFMLVSLALAVFLFYVYDRVTEYLQFKKNVNVEENYVAQMAFPSITFCNQNRIRLTAAADRGWYHSVRAMFPDEFPKAVYRKCREGEFSCSIGECIPLSRRCDAFPDCSDKTDERNCSPCPRLSIKGHPLLDSIVFTLQQHTFMTMALVYVSNASIHNALFLYQQGSSWVISKQFGTEDIIAESTQNNSLHFGTSVPWHFYEQNKKTKVNLIFTCTIVDDIKYITPGANAAKHVRVSDLYEQGTHEMSVFIENCVWKGRKCGLNDFKKRFTELGVCYTFEAEGDMFAESSGPGFGLSLTLNIEQYEYTKNPATGVGIKALLHERDDLPLMGQRSFAISPGLYSLVAIEKTVVENLKPPWGNCSEHPLDYYDHYSVATCTMDCENKLAREQCGCRDAQMPKKGKGDVEVCTIEQYTKCLRPKLDALHTSKDACKCSTQCTEVVYIPSLSFASISMDEDAIKSRSQDEKMAVLQRKLSAAREIAYRVADDKYRQTMRMLNQVDDKLSKFLYFLESYQQSANEEAAAIAKLHAAAKHDCKWLMNLQFNISNIIMNRVLPVIETFRQTLHDTIHMRLLEFRQFVLRSSDDDLPQERSFSKNMGELKMQIKLTNAANRLSDDGIAHWITDATIMRDRLIDVGILTVLKSQAYQLNASLFIMEEKAFVDVQSALDQLTNIDVYMLDNGMLMDEFHTLPLDFQWMTVPERSVMNILKDKLQEYFTDKVFTPLIAMRGTINEIYSNKLDQLVLKSKSRGQAPGFNVSQLEEIVVAFDTIHDSLTDFAMDMLKVASNFASELRRNFAPRCENELEHTISSYDDVFKRTKYLISDITTGIYLFQQTFHNHSIDYKSSKLSLNSLASISGFVELQSFVRSKQLLSNSIVDDRISGVERVHRQLSSIYSWINAQVNSSYLSSNSEYFKHFSTYRNQTETLTAMDNGLTTNAEQLAEIEDFWKGVLAVMNFMRRNQDVHSTSLIHEAEEAHNYLQEFANGNSINENFFKKNYLQVDLFYKTLTDKKVVQQKAYEYPALLCELGGLLGLLLGASVITIFEFLDLLFYNAIVKCCRRRYKKKERKRNTEIARLTRLDSRVNRGSDTDSADTERVDLKSGVYTSKGWFM